MRTFPLELTDIGPIFLLTDAPRFETLSVNPLPIFFLRLKRNPTGCSFAACFICLIQGRGKGMMVLDIYANTSTL